MPTRFPPLQRAEGVTQRVLTSTHDAEQAMQGLEEGIEAIRKFKNAGKID